VNAAFCNGGSTADRDDGSIASSCERDGFSARLTVGFVSEESIGFVSEESIGFVTEESIGLS
jgi:hypothetical protein